MSNLPRRRPDRHPALDNPNRLFQLAFDGLSETTAKLYGGDWDRFLAFVVLDFHEFFHLHKADAAELVNRYLDNMEADDKAPATRSRARQSILVVVARLYRADVALWTLEGLTRAPRVQSYKDVEGICREDWDKLLAAAEAEGSRRGARDVAILLLLHDSGLRRREVATLDLGHFDQGKGRLWVWSKRMEKGDREKVPLNPRQMEALSEWLEHRGSQKGPLFTALQATSGITGAGVAYVVHYWCRKADLPRVGPHQLRHAAITELSRSGATPAELMAFARHTSFDTTQHYIAKTEAEVRKLTEQLGGSE